MSFKLTILGSSSAHPTAKRFPTAHVLNVNERLFLIDCGEGTQIQLRRFKIKFSRINDIFISHLHGDHYLGIFGLISSYNLLGRTNDLHIYAHSDLKEKINFILKSEKLNFKIIYHDLRYSEPQTILETKSIIVKSFPLTHRIQTCGFNFKEKEKLRNIDKKAIEKYKLGIADIVKIKNGYDFTTKSGETIPNNKLSFAPAPPRSYSYCSDTLYSEKIIPVLENTTLLYHEATFADDMRKLAQKTMHSTASDAARIAQKSNSERLIIGHFSSRYYNLEKHKEEAKAIFPNTEIVNDGDVFEV